MGKFKVELKKVVDDSYDILIGHNLKRTLVEDISNGLLGKIKKFAIITDTNVLDLYAQPIYDLLVEKNYKADIFIVQAGEKSKTRETKSKIEDAMLEKGYRRDCAVIAIGGGVVSDLAGFLAGTYGRGVPFITYATTLLAAADASIGGKTAVDTPLATNLIGLFNQPKKVYIDLEAWKTLPDRQMYSGMAETIKHACMASKELFDFLQKNMEKIYSNDITACEYIANYNCEIKYKVVMKDERESGLREVLNLGHTFGRAIETVSDYRLLHGEAVAIGLVAQAYLAKEKDYMTESDVKKVIALLKKANLPTEIPEYIDREKLIEKLYTDKKVRDGKLRFVLEKGIGDVVCFGENLYATPISEEEIRNIINNYFE
ncbi:3-dehydroquinate synthase [Lachnobacterium bovis]|uniref:3-dehydroquinate synthase n=1 Tax=Lachnobacterium bovis TaxID=140626 RepID=UPI00048D1FB9|nr:3-dehydroquinate synthase [Lachnobacterium bovis]